MKLRRYAEQICRKLSEVRKGGLHLLLLAFFLVTVVLIWFLDYFNVEAFAAFNQKFMFDFTWKGRLFYLFFSWLLLLETVLDWEIITEKESISSKRFRILLMGIFAAVPTIYVLSVNFLGLDQTILDLGQALQIRPGFISEHWPLSVEYLVLASFFIFASWLAHGSAGLKSFAISLSLLAGMGVIYLVDTVWPFGTLEPMQLFAVPTAAFATVLLDILGYGVNLQYPVSLPEYGALPQITVMKGGQSASAYVAWPCAGVHSLLLFTLITLVFFKKTTMRRERKVIFFLIGAAGTYLANIFRIASFFAISVQYGRAAGDAFHNTYGELYFIAWMLLYFLIIITVQSGKISRFTQVFRRGG